MTRLALLLLLLLLAFGAIRPAAAQMAPVPVQMLIGLSLPPYVIEAENRGLEYDIVKEALALRGRRMVPRYMAYGSLPGALERGEGDAAMTINPDSGAKACYSDVHMLYRDYAITLASRGLTIGGIDDLKGRSIRAFESATLYFGPGYAAMARQNPAYTEAASQQTQNIMLYAGQVDVIITDKRIFDWYNPSVAGQADVTQPIVVHDILPPLAYRVAFRDPALCASFDQGLAELRRSGRYEAIMASYNHH